MVSLRLLAATTPLTLLLAALAVARPPPAGALPAGAARVAPAAAFRADAATVYSQSGGNVSEDGMTYAATAADKSAVTVSDSVMYTLTHGMITSTGDSSSPDHSSFVDLNAAALAQSGRTITLADSSVTSSGLGANGGVATGSGSAATVDRVAITSSGNGAHAAMTTNGGTLTLRDPTLSAAGASAGAIATDRGPARSPRPAGRRPHRARTRQPSTPPAPSP